MIFLKSSAQKLVQNAPNQFFKYLFYFLFSIFAFNIVSSLDDFWGDIELGKCHSEPVQNMEVQLQNYSLPIFVV